MSNTSSLTPYGVTGAAVGAAAVCAASLILGGLALAKWLSEETNEDRDARDRLRDDQRRERLVRGAASQQSEVGTENLPSISTVALNIREIDPLIQAAVKIGYRPEPSRLSNKDLSQGQHVCMRSAAGERMVITRNAEGRLALSTAGDYRRIQRIVREHTVDQAIAHLKNSLSMDVRTKRLANGEVQILASKVRSNETKGALVRAQVHGDGTAWVDVDQVVGNRCERIVTGLAQAIGAEVSHMKKKDAYFQLPGEAASIPVKV